MTDVGERFDRTLFAAIDALEDRKIEYALIGGVASSGLGRPRSTHDIDIFVRPEEAGAALETLAARGFRTEKTDAAWLFKGFKEGILVDVIFKSRGDIYFDSEMNRRVRRVEYHGREIRVVAPEDLLVIKAAVHDEIGPHHWHDALAILSHATMDWAYLVKRARRAARRILALLIYAQSNDIGVPNEVILELFRSVFGGAVAMPTAAAMPGEQPQPRPAHVASSAKGVVDAYLGARIKDALAHDPRTGEQNISVFVEGQHVILRGEVTTDGRRRASEAVACDCAPGHRIINQLQVLELPAPERSEDVG